MLKVLFICSRNRWRSPTAEAIFMDHPDLEVASAGLNRDSDNPVTPEWILWADIIFVMESAHRKKLSAQYRAYLQNQRIICLNIPDRYPYMDPNLVAELEAKVPPFLR